MQESPTGEKSNPLLQWQSPEFWQGQFITLVPMLAGLAVTGGLRIRGVAAIPAYIIAAELTQWLLSLLMTNPSADGKINKISIPSQQEINLTHIPTKIAYKLVHQIPGRIRLHVPLIAQDITYAQRLQRLLTAHPQVTNVRVNIQAASVAIAHTNPNSNISDWLQLMESVL